MEEITLSFRVPASMTFVVPHAPGLPESERTITVDVAKLATCSASLLHLFQRGIDHMKDVGTTAADSLRREAMKAKLPEPTLEEQAQEARAASLERFAELYANDPPSRGSSGPRGPRDPLLAEVKTILGKRGVSAKLIAADYKDWAGVMAWCKIHATMILNRDAEVHHSPAPSADAIMARAAIIEARLRADAQKVIDVAKENAEALDALD